MDKRDIWIGGIIMSKEPKWFIEYVLALAEMSDADLFEQVLREAWAVGGWIF